MDEANAKNAKLMFGEEVGGVVHFDFYAEHLSLPKIITPEQAYILQWGLINFLKEQGFGFDGGVVLTTWPEERARTKAATNAKTQ